jgi:hypothetical protein
MEIEFEGIYTKAQYFRGVYLARKPSSGSTAMRVGGFVVFTGLLIALAVMTFQDDPSAFRVSKLFQYVFTDLVLGFVIFRPYINSYQTASRLWNDRLTQDWIKGTVTSQGISVGTYHETWDRYNFMRIAEDMVVLLSADRIMLLLLRDFFKSEENWKRVVKLIEKKVVEPK